MFPPEKSTVTDDEWYEQNSLRAQKKSFERSEQLLVTNLIQAAQAGEKIVLVEDDIAKSDQISNYRQKEADLKTLLEEAVGIDVDLNITSASLLGEEEFGHRWVKGSIDKMARLSKNPIFLNLPGPVTDSSYVIFDETAKASMEQKRESNNHFDNPVAMRGFHLPFLKAAMMRKAEDISITTIANEETKNHYERRFAYFPDWSIEAHGTLSEVIPTVIQSEAQPLSLADRVEKELVDFIAKNDLNRGTSFLNHISKKQKNAINFQAQNKNSLVLVGDNFDDGGKFKTSSLENLIDTVDKTTAAVVVDTNGHFLDEILKQVDVLSNKGYTNPVFLRVADHVKPYETGTNIYLIYNDMMPKVHNTALRAKKTVYLGEKISQHLELSELCETSVPVGEDGFLSTSQGDYLTITKQTTGTKNTSLAYDLSNLDKQVSVLDNNMLATLSLVHTAFSDEVKNPLFAPIKNHTLSSEQVQYLLQEANIQRPNFVEEYHAIVDYVNQIPKTTVIHSDPKWDNWFNGNKLGDFAEAELGAESKDLARMLIGPLREYVGKEEIETPTGDSDDYMLFLAFDLISARGTEKYHTIRSQMDKNFSMPYKQFCADTHNQIVTQSLYLANHYKEIDPKLSKELTNIGVNMANGMTKYYFFDYALQSKID